VSVRHAIEPASLYTHFDYAARCCLVVDVSLAQAMVHFAPARGQVRTLLGLMAGWDCAVLLTSVSNTDALSTLWPSPIARRCAVVERDAASVEALRLALQHVWYQTIHLAPVNENVLEPEMEEALARLPVGFRFLLWQAIRDPGDWSVDRLAAAFGVTRRSLERQCRRWGLPSPSAMLQLASKPGSTLRSV